MEILTKAGTEHLVQRILSLNVSVFGNDKGYLTEDTLPSTAKKETYFELDDNDDVMPIA